MTAGETTCGVVQLEDKTIINVTVLNILNNACDVDRVISSITVCRPREKVLSGTTRHATTVNGF